MEGNIYPCAESGVEIHANCGTAMPGTSPKGCSEEGMSLWNHSSRKYQPGPMAKLMMKIKMSTTEQYGIQEKESYGRKWKAIKILFIQLH